METPESLLRRATAAVTVLDARTGRQRGAGTGFMVAPNILATAGHVLLGAGDRSLPESVSLCFHDDGHVTTGRVEASWFFPGRVCDSLSCLGKEPRTCEHSSVDLAFIAVAEPGEQRPHVLLSKSVEVRDTLSVFGHPSGAFRDGKGATGHYEGVSTREGKQLGRWFGTPLEPGHSGSAVLNQRSASVCGMVVRASGHSGSSHFLSAFEIHRRLIKIAPQQNWPSGHLRWLGLLDDDQIHAGGHLFPGARLKAYLEATISASEQHPYAVVVPGVEPPPLAQVYLNQEVLGEDGITFVEPRDAIECLLGASAPAIVTAKPGAGKSSLLRKSAAEAAREWREGSVGRFIPIRVRAEDLLTDLPIAEKLAASVRSEFGAAAVRGHWPAAFFERAPLPGIPWLLLVDGLDEVALPAQRRRVLEELGILQSLHGDSVFRVVLATRHVSHDEMGFAEAQLKRAGVELQPFTADKLTGFAQRWFECLKVAEPERRAREFARETDQASLRDLARNPLMATMLCQLYAFSGERALPTDRWEVYRRYVEILAEWRRRPGDEHERLREILAADLPSASAAAVAEEVHGRALDLIRRLATARLDLDETPAVRLLAAWAADARPVRLRERTWLEFLGEVLRRSGLLCERGGDFVFIHQSLAEFLAAEHIVAHRRLNSAHFRRLFGRNGTLRSGSERFDPAANASLNRFLVAAWGGTEQPEIRRRLEELARCTDVAAAEFIADLVADGVPVGEDLPRAAVATLTGLCRETMDCGHWQRAAAVRRLDGSIDTVRNRRHHEQHVHINPTLGAVALIRLGEAWGFQVLARLAAMPAHAFAAVESLGGLAAGDGAETLAAIAAALPGIQYPIRVRAADLLIDMADPRAADTVFALAQQFAPTAADHLDLVRHLYELGDARGGDLAVKLALNRSVNYYTRIGAARLLISVRDSRSLSALSDLAMDPLLGAHQRSEAIAEIACLGDARDLPLFARLAVDDRYSEDQRVLAVHVIAKLPAAGLHDVLANLIGGPGTAERVRLIATDLLLTIDRERALQAVVQWSRRPDASPSTTVALSAVIGGLDAELVCDLLGPVCLDEKTPLEVRLAGAEIMVRVLGHDGYVVLAEMLGAGPASAGFGAWTVDLLASRYGVTAKQLLSADVAGLRHAERAKVLYAREKIGQLALARSVARQQVGPSGGSATPTPTATQGCVQ